MYEKAGVQKSYNKNSSWKNEMVIRISYSIFILMNLKKTMNQTVQLFSWLLEVIEFTMNEIFYCFIILSKLIASFKLKNLKIAMVFCFLWGWGGGGVVVW